jgi:hypothetical protein
MVFPLIEFVKLPLGCFGMQMRHAIANDRRATRRNKELQAFDNHSVGITLAAGIHPENSEG